MWLTNLAIKRPIVILMFFAALAVVGIRSRGGMPVDLYPKIDFPFVTISTIYPGAGPEEIETLISKPIEDSVGSVNGMKNLTSTSQEGVSVVAIQFELGTNTDTALADVRSKVDAARRLIPRDADAPIVQKFEIGALPVIYLGMSSKRPAKELRQIADDVIKDRLGELKGVAAVNIGGGDVREIQVNVNKHRLEAYGLSINELSQALTMANMNLPSGRVTEGRRDYAIRAMGEFPSVDVIRNLRIKASDNDHVLTVGDIAEVKDSVVEREQITRLQKADSVGITIQKQSDANTVQVADAVKAELQAMKGVLPKDVKIAVIYDQSERVREALSDVNVSLWLGAFLAVLIVFLFLHNIRGTFIVAIAIPMSIIATFIPIFFLGFTMNMMVMLGLSLAVGILVDDSIVVLENIYRHLAKGEDPAEAAFNGRSEIGLAAITITMVDVVVFLPIAFMGGIVGMFFREFGITVATATLFSLLVSFTLTPMLASRWYRKGEAMEATSGFFEKFDRFYHALDRGYRGVLAWALGHRWTVVLTGAGILLAMFAIAKFTLQSEFFPRVDNAQVTASVEMPAGSSLQATDAVIARIEDISITIPEVRSIFANVGSSSTGFRGGETGANYGDVMLALGPKESVLDKFVGIFAHEKRRTKSDYQISEEVRRKMRSIPGGRIKVEITQAMGGGGPPIDLELTGPDVLELSALAQRIKPIFETTEGVQNADVSWKVGKPEVRAVIDRVRAADLGFSVGQIAAALRTSVAGSTDTHFREAGKEYDIRVRLKEFDRESLSDVGRVVIGAIDDKPVYLQDVAKITESTGPTKIERKNRQRKVSVTGSIADGYALDNVLKVLKKKVAVVNPGNASLYWGGEAEHMRESMGDMQGALKLSIALVYMLMAALFESLLGPFIIMFSLPMALVGALLAIVVTGQTMSIITMIGIIMLMGLVTKNAILLVDYTNTLRSRGKERDEAILEAGPTRLRPILMTTFAMIFGMLPTALKLGRGSEMRAPMAIAVIGGLIVSTLLTLVMIPVVYTFFDDLMVKYQARKQRLFGGRK